ncbi:hypothetical protein RND81_03G038100 [Saponaria officinalis]|uniref:Uncharacterized protein n=1 Tax=Saponaria officinalis TaxID=3572 RepID=A0AAW1LY60_SAPOF
MRRWIRRLRRSGRICRGFLVRADVSPLLIFILFFIVLVVFEELKEADITTSQANDRISRGLHNKGHTLSRKLNSDGKVDIAYAA